MLLWVTGASGKVPPTLYNMRSHSVLRIYRNRTNATKRRATQELSYSGAGSERWNERAERERVGLLRQRRAESGLRDTTRFTHGGASDAL